MKEKIQTKLLIVSILCLVVTTTANANPWFEANRRCKDKWPDRQDMRDYCIKNQVDAYNSMPKTTSEIENHCDLKWATNWEMKKYCIERGNETNGPYEINRRPASTVQNSQTEDLGGASAAMIGSALREVTLTKFIFKGENRTIVYCPRCGIGAGYDKALAGKKTTCPRCKDPLVFP
jgi:hypothetical protein